MLDCACHLLHADGQLATATERMVAGLRRLVANGIEQVILTPALRTDSHLCRPQQQRAYRELRTLAGNAALPIDLHLGAENHWNGEWSATRFLQYAVPLDDTGILLIALPTGPLPASLWDFAFDLFRQGYVPMIAAAQDHPELLDEQRRRFERYFCRSGGLLQLDLASVISGSWKASTRHANRFLKHFPDNCLIASGRSFELLTDHSWRRMAKRHRRHIPHDLTALPERRARLRDPADLPPRPTRQWTAPDNLPERRASNQDDEPTAATVQREREPDSASDSTTRPMAPSSMPSSSRSLAADTVRPQANDERSTSSRRRQTPSERLGALTADEQDNDLFVVLAVDDEDVAVDAQRTSLRALVAAGEAALRADDAAAALNSFDQVLESLEGDLQQTSAEHDRQLACSRILSRRAAALVQLDQRRQAFRDLTRARRLSQEADDLAGSGHALLAMSEILEQSEQYAPADDLAREALTAARRLGDPLRLTICLTQHGRLAASMQQWDSVEEVTAELCAHSHQLEAARACIELVEALEQAPDLSAGIENRLHRWQALLDHDGIQRHAGIALHCRYRRACLLATVDEQRTTAIAELEGILIAYKQLCQHQPDLPLPEALPAMHLTVADCLCDAGRHAEALARLQLARFELQHLQLEGDETKSITLRLSLDLARIHARMADRTSEQNFLHEALDLAETLTDLDLADEIRRALDGLTPIPTLRPAQHAQLDEHPAPTGIDPITSTTLWRARQESDPDTT